MAKMVGKASHWRWRCPCCEPYSMWRFNKRRQKRKEKREWQKELKGETS